MLTTTKGDVGSGALSKLAEDEGEKVKVHSAIKTHVSEDLSVTGGPPERALLP